MPWDIRPIERELEARLKSGKEGITETEGQQHFADYVFARQRLVEEILPDIKAVEGSLTDHSERHIANVLDNIYSLIGENSDRVTVTELYFLCTIALFHDVGNIHGREGHYDRRVIYKIYSYVRNGDPRFEDEKSLVAEVASKHSGRASDGSTDTIKELRPEKTGFWNKGIHLQKCAAILRLADECAEGRQRTSNFMLINHKYKKKSRIHHEYANCSSIFIDKEGKRIALTYKIKIDTSDSGVWSKVEKLITYILKRILKINNERLYNKYYSEILSDFKKVEAVMNFEVDSIPISIGLKELVLNDLVIPSNEEIKDVFKSNSEYDVKSIIQKIKLNLSGNAE